MPNQEIINYIKQCREKKIADYVIRDELLKVGWAGGDITEAFVYVDRKDAFKFGILAGLFFAPVLFLLCLIEINPFALFDNSRDIRSLYENSIISVIFWIVLIAVSCSAFYERITIAKEKPYKFIYIIPFSYFLTSAPLFIVFFLLGVFSDKFGFAFIFSSPVLMLVSAAPVIFLGLLIFLWFRYNKIFPAVLYFLSIILLSSYIFTKVIVGGCYSSDLNCITTNIMVANMSEGGNNGPTQDFCEKAREPGNCYEKLVHIQRYPDASTCERITAENSQGSGEPLNFSYYPNNKNNCYWAVAGKYNDLSLCNKITNENHRGSCISLINFKLAIEKSDISHCNKMNRSFSISNYEDTLRLGYAGKISYIQCYVVIGLKDNNQRICDLIDDQNLKKWCYYEYAVKKGDCSLVPPDSPATRTQCETSDAWLHKK